MLEIILTGCGLGGACYPALLPSLFSNPTTVGNTHRRVKLLASGSTETQRGHLGKEQRGVFLIPFGKGRGHLPSPAEIYRYLFLSHTLHHKTPVLPGMGRARSAAWPCRSVNNPERLAQGNSSCLLPPGLPPKYAF